MGHHTRARGLALVTPTCGGQKWGSPHTWGIPLEGSHLAKGDFLAKEEQNP